MSPELNTETEEGRSEIELLYQKNFNSPLEERGFTICKKLALYYCLGITFLIVAILLLVKYK